MGFPNSAYPPFWAWIIGALWIIITLTIFFEEKDRVGKANILSGMAVSSLVCIVLSVFGTLLGVIDLPIMIYILVFGILIIIVWFFSQK